MTLLDWLASWPVLVLLVGGVVVGVAIISDFSQTARAVMASLGSVVIMAGMAFMTLFVWGLGGVWLMVLAGLALSRLVWVLWQPSRGLALLAAALTNIITLAVLLGVAIMSSSGSPTPGSG